MGFAQEIKDFVSGFQAGYKMIETPTESEKERRALKKAQDEAESGGGDVGARRAGLGSPDRYVTPGEAGGGGGGGGGGYRRDGGGGGGSSRSFIDTPVSVDDAGLKAILTEARKDSGANGYNALTYKRGGGGGGTADLTNMTLDEVDALQRRMPSMGHASSAVGGYQFVRDTLRGARSALNLPGDTKFTPAVQDMLAAQLVKQRGYDSWKSGKLSDAAFQRNLSREWAILPRDASGRGSYDGYNGNRAGVSHQSIMSAFDIARGKPRIGLKTEPVTTYAGPDYARSEGLKGRRAEEVTRASTDEDFIKDDEDIVSFENGGLVPHYASGGMVEEEEAPLPPTRPSGIRLPSDVPPAAPRNVDPSAGRESFREDAGTRGAPVEFSPRDFTNLELVGEAAHEGLMGIQNIFGFDRGVRDPDKLRAFVRNEGKATPEEIRAVDQVIGADRLSPEERNIARLNAGYKFYRDRGQPLKARQYAASMLMAVNDTVRNLGAVAEVAIRNGDYKGAAKAIAAGKGAIPDGESVRVVGEPGKGGVQFEVFDQDGNVTEKGRASIDDLMSVSTGMQNGTLFFEQAGLIKQKTARERMLEKRQKANEAFEATEPQGAFRDRYIDTLTEPQRKAFLKLHHSDQKAKIQEWERGLTAAERAGVRAQAQENTERRLGQGERKIGLSERRLENQEGNAAQRQQNFETRQAYRIRRDEVLDGRWEEKRKHEMTKEEAQLAQRILEEDGRNRRHDLSLEQRRMLRAQADSKAINQTRGTGGGRMSKAERGVAQAEAIGQAERSAIANDPAEYGVDINAETPAAPQQGPTLGIARRLEAADAGTAWERQVKQSPNRFNQNNIASIDRQIEEMDPEKKVGQRERYMLRMIATDMMKANDVGGDQAAATAAAMLKNPQNIRVLPDGRVQVDPNVPPLYVSRQALAQIAAIMSTRQAPVTQESKPKPAPGVRSPYLLPDPRVGINASGR